MATEQGDLFEPFRSRRDDPATSEEDETGAKQTAISRDRARVLALFDLPGRRMRGWTSQEIQEMFLEDVPGLGDHSAARLFELGEAGLLYRIEIRDEEGNISRTKSGKVRYQSRKLPGRSGGAAIWWRSR